MKVVIEAQFPSAPFRVFPIGILRESAFERGLREESWPACASQGIYPN